MNQAELDRLPRRVVPGPEHIPAVGAHRPLRDAAWSRMSISYPELALRLRLQAEQVVEGWLPPATRDEPKVNPLHRGAGQFPTIGRAALFGTFMEGIAPAVRDISRRGRQAGQLRRGPARPGRQAAAGRGRLRRVLGGGRDRGRDLLRLPAHHRGHGGAAQQHAGEDLPAGADAVGVPGGPRRRAGRRAQRGPGAARPVPPGRPAERRRRRARCCAAPATGGPVDAEDVAVTYPDNTRLVMRPGTMQTGFLFSLPGGASREDMHRSIVSLVLSLVGTEMSRGRRPEWRAPPVVRRQLRQRGDRTGRWPPRTGSAAEACRRRWWPR